MQGRLLKLQGFLQALAVGLQFYLALLQELHLSCQSLLGNSELVVEFAKRKVSCGNQSLMRADLSFKSGLLTFCLYEYTEP